MKTSMQDGLIYPSKLLNMTSYGEQVFIESKDMEYANLDNEISKKCIYFILHKLDSIVEHAQKNNHVKETLDFLSELKDVSTKKTMKEYMDIMRNKKKPKNSFLELFAAHSDPGTVIELMIGNNHFSLEENEIADYARFLNKVAKKCITELVPVNKAALEPSIKSNKKVSFSATTPLFEKKKSEIKSSGIKRPLEDEQKEKEGSPKKNRLNQVRIQATSIGCSA